MSYEPPGPWKIQTLGVEYLHERWHPVIDHRRLCDIYDTSPPAPRPPPTFWDRHHDLAGLLVILGWLLIGPALDWLCNGGGAFAGLWLGGSFIFALLIAAAGALEVMGNNLRR